MMQVQQMQSKRHHGILDAMAMQWQEEKSKNASQNLLKQRR
jgi:hypothetical protein